MKLVLVLPALALGCAAESGPPPVHAESVPTVATDSASDPPPAPASQPLEPPAKDAPVDEAPDFCTGQATPELAAELRERAVESRHCYERALREDKSLMGRMLVAATYAADGSVREVTVAKDEVGHAVMASCVSSLFDAPVQAAPTGGCVVIHIPLNFKPRTPEDAASDAPSP
ncbi:MAG TPA: AgmX/PglI C-terminal domain-containing protein [Polyangiaceae bacterium]